MFCAEMSLASNRVSLEPCNLEWHDGKCPFVDYAHMGGPWNLLVATM